MKKIRRILCLFTALLMLITLTVTSVTVSAADMSIKFAQKTITIPVGKALTLKPTLTGVKASELTWSTSDKAVASVTKKGKVTAKKNGTAVITAKKGKTSAKITIKVGKRVTSVTVKETAVTLCPGETYKISAGIKPVDAAYKAVAYSVSDKSVLSVKGSTVTAVKTGTSSVTVRAADGSAKKASITFTVIDPPSKTPDAGFPDQRPDADAPEKRPDPDSPETPPAPQEEALANFNTNISAKQLTSRMGIGWNLGNSLDALGGSGLSSETAWGNPKTTKKLVDDIKAAGFDTIRIPTTWGQHCDAKGDPDSAWMDRVQQVVDYAYNNGMYVILNDHHDCKYYNIDQMVADEAYKQESIDKMSNLWTHISKRFKNYGDKLIFEVLNEPRTEGSAREWSGGTAPERAVLADFEDALVKAIRATGGNNAYRFIMVPAYAATSDMNILRQTKFPADDRVIISVHAYSPYNFAMNGSGPSEFTEKDRADLEWFFKALDDTFVSNGKAVVIGEFGCINKNNDADRIVWAQAFVGGAKQYGIPCVLWDNNSPLGQTGSETFGY
ncbi:MAG: cellulase family glycosylhydrolase, partial [Oscillospiraceae bacterium]|nr:cellulase family glycosylhydrolase [Oscillospiraceae bacterium]